MNEETLMGEIVLLLGNSAPHEVHRPERIEEDGTPVWGPKTRGEVFECCAHCRTPKVGAPGACPSRAEDEPQTHEWVADWQGRGPHRIFTLDPTDSPHTTVIVPAERAHHVLHDISHLWDYHSADPASYVTVLDDGGDRQLAEQIRMAANLHFGLRDPNGPVALIMNAGLDYAAAQLGGVASATAIAKYVAITANSTAPVATDTTLTGEIATAGGGLVRAAATYAHTAGASNYTLTITFTANASDVLPVTVNKAGVFTASSAGAMTFEDLISPAITFNASGDAGTLTETVTI